MYENKTIIQIGSHIGNTINDPIFKHIDKTTKLILVEPVSFLFEQLKVNYTNKLKDTTNITFINKAVSSFIGTIKLTIPSQKNKFENFPFWASQLSSVNSNHIKEHIKELITEEITVPTTTISQIIKENKIEDIYLLHIDTEGHDFEILMSYDFKLKPQKIIFEKKHMGGTFKTGENYITLIKKLTSLDYTIHSSNTEDITMILK